MKAYRKTVQGRVPAGDQVRITQLLDKPAPGSTSVDLISQIVVHLNLHGEAFLGKYRADGEIVQLGLIHPESVQVELQGQRIVYTPSTARGLIDVGPDDVLHIKGMTVDGLRGLSPVTQCRVAIGLSSSLQRSAKVFTEHGSRPAGILSAPKAGHEPVDHLRTQWRMRHGGVENMHQISILSGDVTFTPLGFSGEDAQFLQ